MKPFYNGLTIEVPYDSGSTMVFRGTTYSLKQFHFHAPNEHTLGGKSYPLEIHFVHKDDQGCILVVGVFVEEGKLNAPSADTMEARNIFAQGLLPQTLTYYNYQGSLSTPPCSEGVTWVVLKEALEASPEQLKWIPSINKGPNNRPVQELNGRVIKTIDW